MIIAIANAPRTTALATIFNVCSSRRDIRTSAIPPCASCFRFGPSHPVSKLLKFFKLLGQYTNTEIQLEFDECNQGAALVANFNIRHRSGESFVAAGVGRPEPLARPRQICQLNRSNEYEHALNGQRRPAGRERGANNGLT